LYTFEQAREELEHHTRDLKPDLLWMTPAPNVASLGFHLKHIAGSVDRLATYLAGQSLSTTQLDYLRGENSAGPETLPVLLQRLSQTFARVEEQVRGIPPDHYLEPRAIGRKALPTTVAGLIIHISEHTQRHLGQAVLTVKLLLAQQRS